MFVYPLKDKIVYFKGLEFFWPSQDAGMPSVFPPQSHQYVALLLYIPNMATLAPRDDDLPTCTKEAAFPSFAIVDGTNSDMPRTEGGSKPLFSHVFRCALYNRIPTCMMGRGGGEPSINWFFLPLLSSFPLISTVACMNWREVFFLPLWE